MEIQLTLTFIDYLEEIGHFTKAWQIQKSIETLL